MKNSLIILILCLGIWQNTRGQERPQIEIQTSMGNLIVELYHETPQHRDNFLKLVQDEIYDSLLFHRVIEEFMIQGGDTESKNAAAGEALGSSALPYQVPAEFHPDLFHKKGALAAARTNNPQRASSSTQFYLVQGKIQNDSLLAHNEGRINTFLQRHYAVNNPNNKALLDSMNQARELKDTLLVRALSEKWETRLANQEFEKYTIPDSHRKVYQEIGGTPHLDQNYTVFGQVISGLEVIDAIAAVDTDQRNRPLENVYILKMIWLNPSKP
ncbi:peptidylprolyl isomerase [Algoriphagus limi]|uniref:peptidylprolyl isomerase n=1 Tax=Algoriphagus limi TaxID=2975273 RepID=A0ABT2G7U5_9BACT|nr:peptidylprolyl isomerase [Algoriphagus limi]MCS5491342.1 peptidylprolyl isomerase [Algoriphagus limi]